MRKIVLLCLLTSLLSACHVFTEHPAEVQKIRPSTRSTQGKHIVSWGETLYSIAWMYDTDVQELARINHISVNHRVQAGDHLLLSGVANASPRAMYSHAPKAALKKQSKVSDALVKQESSAKQPSVKGWLRPVKGKGVLTAERRGLEFEGHLGDPIRAAQDGKVVYRGEGIRGYGQLLILKHANEWLTAYAHNDVILVEEGAQVKAGQVVAHMGQTGANRVKLYFEIRQKGKPVDPTRVTFF